MPVPAVNASSSTIASAAAPPASRLGKDDFLKLLMAQVSNQDPLSPMDNQAFVTQLAQFSSVELLQTPTQQLDSLVLAQASNNQVQAASLVGKTADFRGGAVTLDGAGAGASIPGSVSANAQLVTVTITDANGRVVRTAQLGATSSGSLSYGWDGRDDAGAVLPAGTYTASFTAADASGHDVPAQTWGTARITGVSFASGFAELVLSTGATVRLSDVVRIVETAS